MNKKAISLLAIVGTLVCAVAALAFAPSKDADTLKALDAEWSKAAVAHNADKVASYYADDAVAYPPDMPAAVGKTAARKIWGEVLADKTSSLSWKTTTAAVDGNLGYTAGTYEDSSKGKDGKMVTTKGKYVCIWHKGADGKWKAIHDIWNSDSK